MRPHPGLEFLYGIGDVSMRTGVRRGRGMPVTVGRGIGTDVGANVGTVPGAGAMYGATENNVSGSGASAIESVRARAS